MILISDLLVPPETLRGNLALLRSRGHEVMILRTLDPGEPRLTISGPVTVRDLESGQERSLDPAAVAAYQQNFAAHRDQLQAICDALGVDLYELLTDRPLADALLQVVSTQKRRSGRTARRAMLRHGAASGSGGGAT